MRKDVLATVSAVALSTGFAFAAQAAPPLPMPIFTWTGCYVGVQAGLDAGNSKWNDPFPSGWGTVTYGTSGGIVGGQVGCNYQMQNFVIGAEGELWGSSLSGSTSKLLGGEGGGLFSFHSKSDIAGDLSVRAGYAFDRVLLFSKIGAAWAHYSFTETYPSVNSPDTGQGDYSGLLLGLGVEYAIDLHWSVKGEYDYINYGSKNIPMYMVTGAYDYSPKISNYENIFKAAVNYRF
jgi:outer membrane immunogenic protein